MPAFYRRSWSFRTLICFLSSYLDINSPSLIRVRSSCVFTGIVCSLGSTSLVEVSSSTSLSDCEGSAATLAAFRVRGRILSQRANVHCWVVDIMSTGKPVRVLPLMGRLGSHVGVRRSGSAYRESSLPAYALRMRYPNTPIHKLK